MAKETQSAASSSATSSPVTRTVNIVTTRGQKTKIEFSGTKWSELKSLLERGGTDVNGNTFSGYDLRNMKSVESINKHTLEHPDADIPSGDFALFLMPYKSKSGASKKAPEKTASKAAPKKAASKAAPKKETPKAKATAKAAPKKDTKKATPKPAAKAAKTTKVVKPKYSEVLELAQKLDKRDREKLARILLPQEQATSRDSEVTATAKAQDSQDAKANSKEPDYDGQLRDLARGFNDVRI